MTGSSGHQLGKSGCPYCIMDAIIWLIWSKGAGRIQLPYEEVFREVKVGAKFPASLDHIFSPIMSNLHTR